MSISTTPSVLAFSVVLHIMYILSAQVRNKKQTCTVETCWSPPPPPQHREANINSVFLNNISPIDSYRATREEESIYEEGKSEILRKGFMLLFIKKIADNKIEKSFKIYCFVWCLSFLFMSYQRPLWECRQVSRLRSVEAQLQRDEHWAAS